MPSGKGCFKCRLDTRRGNGVEVKGLMAMRASSSGSSQHLQVTHSSRVFFLLGKIKSQGGIVALVKVTDLVNGGAGT